MSFNYVCTRTHCSAGVNSISKPETRSMSVNFCIYAFHPFRYKRLSLMKHTVKTCPAELYMLWLEMES